jgi:hypothetical protein
MGRRAWEECLPARLSALDRQATPKPSLTHADIHSDGGSRRAAAAHLPGPVYAVLGNHDSIRMVPRIAAST